MVPSVRVAAADLAGMDVLAYLSAVGSYHAVFPPGRSNVVYLRLNKSRYAISVTKTPGADKLTSDMIGVGR